MVCVSNGTTLVRVSCPCVTRCTRSMVSEPCSLTLTLSSLPTVMPLESRIDAAGSLPSGAWELLPSAITVTGPFLLITMPPVSCWYTLSILMVMAEALLSFALKKPISWSALSATVQKGMSSPSTVTVV